MSTITAAAVNSKIQDIDNAIRQGLTSGNIEQVMKAQRPTCAGFSTSGRLPTSPRSARSLQGPCVLWGFVVAWKGASKKADNAFIETQRAQLVRFDTEGQALPSARSARPAPRAPLPSRRTVTPVAPVLPVPMVAPTPLSPRLATPTPPSPRADTSRPARPPAGTPEAPGAGVGRTPGGRDSAVPERDRGKGKRKARADSEGEEANARVKLPRKAKVTPVEEEDEEMDVDDEAEEEEEEPRPVGKKPRLPPRQGSKMMERACDRCIKGRFECWEQARGITACHRCGVQRVACTFDGISKKGKKKNDPIVIDTSSSQEDDDDDNDEEAPIQKKISAPASKGKGKARAKSSAPVPKKRSAAAKPSVPTKASARGKTPALPKLSAVPKAAAPGPSKKSALPPAPSTPRFAALERDTSGEPEDLMEMVDRMDTLVSRVDELERQVDDVDTSNGDHNLALVGFGQKFVSLEGRIDKLEKMVRHQAKTIGKMNSSLQWLDEGQQALQVNVKALREYVGMPVPIPASRQSSPVSAASPVPLPAGAPAQAVSAPSAPPAAPAPRPSGLPASVAAPIRSCSVPAPKRPLPPSRAASAPPAPPSPAPADSAPVIPPQTTWRRVCHHIPKWFEATGPTGELNPPTPQTSQDAAQYNTIPLVPTPPSTAPTTKPPVEQPAAHHEPQVPLPPRPHSHSPWVSPAPGAGAGAGAGGDAPSASESRASPEPPAIPHIAPEQPPAPPRLLAVPDVNVGGLSPRRSRRNSPVPESERRRSPRHHTRSPSPAANPSSSPGGKKRAADATAEQGNAKRARQS
ncbi:hypothetical protein BDZ97DRAFT_1930444 [Flammula alnicola]|nr:hypothetical protein BDZ97DRAFT_1930444 [Flammula alnicola]